MAERDPSYSHNPEEQPEVRGLERPLGAVALNRVFSEEDRAALHERLDEVIDTTNIDPNQLKGFRVSQWDGMAKNNEGQIETKTLRAIELVAETKSSEPAWEPVRRVESAPIKFTPEKKYDFGEYRRDVVLPDVQIGYRKYEDGTIDPFHDEKAISVALQIIEDVKPARVILLGDFLDLPNFSRFEQTPEFAETTNMSIEYGHNLLKTIREIVPEAEIVLLEGNHDRRLEKQVRTNLMAAYSLKRAGEELPVLSIPYLLNLEQLNIKYVGAYPAGRYFITPQLQAIHGEIVRKGATAKAVTEHEGISTIHGHTHRIEHYARTVRTYEGGRQTYAFSPGTLSRIDGAVPSVHGSTEVNGKPVFNYEDWQQGLAIIDHNGLDFTYQQITMPLNHVTRFEGKTFSPAE